MRETLGVKIDCRAAAKSLDHPENHITAHWIRLCELAPAEAPVLAANIKGLSREQASVLLIALGDKTFADRDQLVAFVGLDVRVRQRSRQELQDMRNRSGAQIPEIPFGKKPFRSGEWRC
jgi:hypothetical protein